MTTNPKRVAAGHKAVETKGEWERSREAYMAAWTRANRKDDAANPYSRQNCPPTVLPTRRRRGGRS
jgi:hypothetical protein